MLYQLSIINKKVKQDTLHISSKSDKIQGELSMFKFRDKDTRQMIFYIPSLDLTSYGATEEKALEMMNFSVNDFFDYLHDLSNKKRELELANLGWKHHPLKNKQFSKAYVDFSGQLQNFNAVGDQVEQLTLVA